MKARVAANDYLTASISLWLQQDGVHVDRRLEATRLGLNRLCPPYFSSIDTDRRIVRHVLRLERGDPNAGIREESAQRSDYYALADVRRSAHHH